MLLTLVTINCVAIVGLCVVIWDHIGTTKERLKSLQAQIDDPQRGFPIYGPKVPRDKEQRARGF